MGSGGARMQSVLSRSSLIQTAAVLKVPPRNSHGSPDRFRGSTRSQLYDNTKHYLPFSLPMSQEYTVAFSRDCMACAFKTDWTQTDTRIQLSFVKPDPEEIFKYEKQCHSSHRIFCFAKYTLHSKPPLLILLLHLYLPQIIWTPLLIGFPWWLRQSRICFQCRKTWVWSLGWKHALEKEMATHSSILAWRIVWTKEPGGLQSMGSQRDGHTNY